MPVIFIVYISSYGSLQRILGRDTVIGLKLNVLLLNDMSPFTVKGLDFGNIICILMNISDISFSCSFHFNL